MSTALFLGRFQPIPHKGHVRVIQEILAHYDSIIIGLGSSQYSGTRENLLTVEERTQMLTRVFETLGVAPQRFTILPVPDIHDDARYVEHVVKHVPPFDCVFSGNELVQRLFHEKGYAVTWLERYETYEGARIREMMLAGDESWREMVPAVSETAVQEFDILERLQSAQS